MLSCLSWAFVCALGKGVYGRHISCLRDFLSSGEGAKKGSATLNIPVFLNPVGNESPNSAGVIVITVIGENEIFSVPLTQLLPSQPAGSLQTLPHASESTGFANFAPEFIPGI